ncbi:hypothetical protein AB0D67_03720 [Streptosporangium sp. NPDC048047]|uniref:lipopolysaccharide biosynthesis protein n=1 Tax=Streptosporangium sp. NPDC048047 TaxID=3155748 RepID=UPI0034199E97
MRLPGRRHLRTFTSLSGAGVGEALLPALSLMALVRLTGTHVSGQVIFAQSVAGVWFLLLDPCLENAAQRFVPMEQERSGRGASLFAGMLRWDVLIGVAVTGAGLAVVAAVRLLGLAPAEVQLMLALAVVTRGAMAPYGTASAGFALADRLQGLGLLRLGCAVLSFGLSVGGLLAGGALLYLAGQAVAAAVMAPVYCALATRVLRAGLGPPGPRVPMPAGMIPFLLKTSVGTTVAGVSDVGILSFAGFIGGPSLVTILKIASAPGRFYANLAIPIAAMLYPRISHRIATDAGTAAVRRDMTRTTWLFTVAGAVTVAAALPVIDDVMGLAYGHGYARAGGVAMLLLAAACVKGMVLWSNVLPLALGRAGWRLAYLTAEGVCFVAVLAVAHLAAPEVFRTSLVYGWGVLAAAVAGTGFWIVSMRRVLADDRSRPLDPDAGRIPGEETAGAGTGRA